MQVRVKAVWTFSDRDVAKPHGSSGRINRNTQFKQNEHICKGTGEAETPAFLGDFQ